MKTLSIQIQPGRSPGLDLDAAVAALRSIHACQVVFGEDNGQFVNVASRSLSLSQVWHSVRKIVRFDDSLAKCCIVVAEGEIGWDDYLLLHHYDQGEPLDELT